MDIVKLHTLDQGAGMPVVLLHGFPFDHTLWAAQIEALSPAYRVIAPDLRGHGRSPAPEGAYSMDALADDVLAALDERGIERAVWFGHSLGGYVTMAALRRAPARIAAIGLVATHPHPDTPDKRLQRIQSAELTAAKGMSDLALSMMAVLFAPELDRQSAPAQAVYAMMQRTAPVGAAGALRAMADRPDSVATLQAAHLPAVVIAGAADHIVSLDVAEDMAALANASLVTVEGAGHLPMIEQPDATTAALRAFLGALDQGGTRHPRT